MPDIAFDLRYLRYAILAAEKGSFRRTAEMLDVSQSTVSRRIQLLERRVGIPLFERNRSGARVTPAGKRFLCEAGIGADRLHQAVHAVALAKRGHFGTLRVGLTTSLANGFLADLLAEYHRNFPAIEMTFEEASSETTTYSLLDGSLDVAFMSGDLPPPGFRNERLWDERRYIAVPDYHEFASLNVITWDDVKRETFLVMADATGPETADLLFRQLSAPGFRPTISVHRVGCANLLSMVARGFGVAITGNSSVSIAYPGVCFVPIASGEETVSFSVVWSTSNQNPVLKFMIEMCLEHARKRQSHRL